MSPFDDVIGGSKRHNESLLRLLGRRSQESSSLAFLASTASTSPPDLCLVSRSIVVDGDDDGDLSLAILFCSIRCDKMTSISVAFFAAAVAVAAFSSFCCTKMVS